MVSQTVKIWSAKSGFSSDCDIWSAADNCELLFLAVHIVKKRERKERLKKMPKKHTAVLLCFSLSQLLWVWCVVNIVIFVFCCDKSTNKSLLVLKVCLVFYSTFLDHVFPFTLSQFHFASVCFICLSFVSCSCTVRSDAN